MNLWCYLNKPEYLFRPQQILTRLRYRRNNRPAGFIETKLIWGVPLRVRPSEAIGASVCSLGLYDLTVSETIWRLLAPGGCGVDVGANIGHMSSIMAVRVGSAGVVHIFEPHPEVYQELDHNVHLWAAVPGVCRVQAHQLGVSDANGGGIIEMPDSFDGNRGTAYVVPTTSESHSGGVHGVRNAISLCRLDDFWASNGQGRRIDVMKIDVEGHELSVLKGAAGMIKEGMIKDIVFEENRPYPTDVTDYLSKQGYEVYLLDKGLLGPLVSRPVQGRPPRIPWEPPAYLATKDSKRALGLLKQRGWHVLQVGNTL